MKVAVIFVLLFATVLCRPAKKVSLSSSESSEEVVRRPAAQPSKKQAVVVPQARAAPVQNVVAAAASSSDESTEGSDEDEQAAVEAPVEVKSDISTTASTDTASVNSKDSEDSDDDDDDDDEADESETEEDESSDSSESGESSTALPSTFTPVIVTEEPVPETTAVPIIPTIVTDEEASRGDSFGGYPSDYKSIIYVEDKSYHKVPGPYKSYEFVNTGKKMAYDMTEGNDVEKSLQVYKAIHVHSDFLEEGTSTPEVESQGLDASSGTAQDQDINDRQAALPEEDSASASDPTTSESSSTPQEEEEDESASTASDSASASEESENEESESSEEATATPGAADSDSDESESNESDSDEEGAGPEITTDVPVVITAK